MFTNTIFDCLNQKEEAKSLYRDSSNSHRDILADEDLQVPKSLPRILLVDDDPVYTKIVKRFASQRGIDLSHCNSVGSFSDIENWNYDVVLMDYDLGAVNGFELTSYLERYANQELPVVLVSQTKHKPNRQWPESIREFVHKSLGPLAVLEAAIEAHEVNCIHKMMDAKKLKSRQSN